MKLLYAWMNCPELLEIVTKHCLPLMPEQVSHSVNVIVLLSIDVLGYNQACMLSFRCSIPAWQLNICTICIARLQAEACHCSFSTAVTTCPVVPALFASLSTITILFYTRVAFAMLLWAPSLYYIFTQFAFAMAFNCYSWLLLVALWSDTCINERMLGFSNCLWLQLNCLIGNYIVSKYLSLVPYH